MLSRLTELEAKLVRVMNKSAEARRRGQSDVAETLTVHAAKILVKIADAKAAERVRRRRRVHLLFNLLTSKG